MSRDGKSAVGQDNFRIIGKHVQVSLFSSYIDLYYRVVLDPIFPSPDLQNNRKLLINELP